MCVNIASGQTYSVTDILQTVMEVDQCSNATVDYDSTRPQTIDVLTLDVRLAKEKLDFEARTSLPDGIRKTIAWLKENPSN